MLIEKSYKNELLHIFKSIGLKANDNVYLTGNIGLFGKVRIPKNDKMNIFVDCLFEIIGDEGTLFSPSASMNLCNTEIPFDINLTPSNKMGAFAEYIRKRDDSIRSMHPFWSISGIGKNADILNNVSRHSYGVGSPWSKFLDLDTKQLNFGLHPSKAVTLIHHIETIVGVPYRYTKEFIHPIVRNDKIINEEFYQLVMYKDSDIEKKIKLNEHFFLEMKKRNIISKLTHSTGMNFWSFKMQDFYNVSINFFKKDIYTYLENKPIKRPYQK